MCTEFEWNNDTKCRTHQKPYYYYNKFFAHSLLVSRRQWFQCVSLFKRWGHSMPLTAFVGRIQTAHATLSSRTGEQKSRCVHAVNETKRPDNQMNDVKRRNFNRGTFIMYIKTMRTNLKLTNFQRNWHNIIRLKRVYLIENLLWKARPTNDKTNRRARITHRSGEWMWWWWWLWWCFYNGGVVYVKRAEWKCIRSPFWKEIFNTLSTQSAITFECMHFSNTSSTF